MSELPPTRCASCGTRHYRNPACCAGALVFGPEGLLLVCRELEPWRGRWDIPGGFCEVGEHPSECAIREVREETGAEIRVTGLHGIWVDPPGSSTSESGAVCIYYRAEMIAMHPIADRTETRSLGWFAPEDIPTELAFPGHLREVIDTLRPHAPTSSLDRTVRNR
ncbi:NUDIX hydrolase [Nocardia takedensis]